MMVHVHNRKTCARYGGEHMEKSHARTEGYMRQRSTRQGMCARTKDARARMMCTLARACPVCTLGCRMCIWERLSSAWAVDASKAYLWTRGIHLQVADCGNIDP